MQEIEQPYRPRAPELYDSRATGIGDEAGEGGSDLCFVAVVGSSDALGVRSSVMAGGLGVGTNRRRTGGRGAGGGGGGWYAAGGDTDGLGTPTWAG
jgi:hypothetical protein